MITGAYTISCQESRGDNCRQLNEQLIYDYFGVANWPALSVTTIKIKHVNFIKAGVSIEDVVLIELKKLSKFWRHSKGFWQPNYML